MDSQSIHQSNEDNREAEKNRQSRRSSGKYSEVSLKAESDKNADSVAGDRARTRTRDPDRDRISDYEKNSDHYYSDESENVSLSNRSRSLSSCSRSPSPRPRKTERVNNQVTSRRGLNRKGLQRAGSKQPRPGVLSQSKDPPPKDLDLVTKRVLSARLLKINEQRNELSEAQLRLGQLQRENKALRQLQRRQERALGRFDDTESEIAQLISRHGNETHALRERLRRTQERERAADRRLRDVDEELRRAKAALQKLRKLADDRQLGEREELARKLAHAQDRLQEDDRRIKELERNMELSSGSFQRQLASERKKTHEVQEEVRNLREELDRVTHKLKEKERELDTRNIYANRMLKGTPRKETESGVRRRGPCSEASSRCSTKGVQTEERRHEAADFPPPPPPVADFPQRPKEDSYLSLKELQEDERPLGRTENERRPPEREKEENRQGLHARQEKAFRTQELQDEEEEEKDEGRGQTLFQKEEGRKGRSPGLFHGQRDPEEERKPTNQDPTWEKQEEERRRKEQLLAKMRAIDRQPQHADVFADIAETKPADSPPLFPEPKTQRPFAEPAENPPKGLPSEDSSDSLRKPAPSGRRGLNPQGALDDLSFGGYAPSFGRPAGRAGVSGGKGGGAGLGGGAEEKHREVPDADPAKEKKSSLMQQLFGSSPANGHGDGEASTMEVLSPPPARKAANHNGNPFPWETAKKRENPPSRRDKSPLQVTHSRPAVRAIGSFDDDIEEVTL